MAAFTETPTYTYEEEIAYRTVLHVMEDGKSVSNSKGTARRVFTLEFSQIDQTTRDAIITFFSARVGPEEAFDWENPNDGVTYSVRFVPSSLESNENDYQIYTMRFQFIEVI
jgi:hypothetical protein